MTHEDYKEMLATSALSALEAEESVLLSTHLEHCQECSVELDEWQETAAMVALGSGSAEPSVEVRERIMASIRTERRTSVRVGPTADADTADSRVIRLAKPPRKDWFAFGSVGSIAALIAIVSLLVGLFALWQQHKANKAELARMATEMRKTNEQLAIERALVALLRTPGARMTELSGTNAAPGAHAMLAYDQTGHAMLMTKNLPTAPPGMAYQLWFIKDNKKMPGKVFTTDESGNGVLEDQIPTAALGSAVYAITLEPEKGVEVPTGAIYLVSAS